MKTLGIIPARGGSKTIPEKNLREVGGKPLVGRAIAGSRSVVDFLVVSTDDEKIAECARNYGCRVVNRPARLAQDDSPSLPVAIHALHASMAIQPDFDVVVLLQPTSPFRTPEDIQGALELMERTKADSVISMCDRPIHTAYKLRHANRVEEVPRLIVPNGAIYAIRADRLMMGESWFSGEVFAYMMPKDRSLDIDTKLDLEIARFMIDRESAA